MLMNGIRASQWARKSLVPGLGSGAWYCPLPLGWAPGAWHCPSVPELDPSAWYWLHPSLVCWDWALGPGGTATWPCVLGLGDSCSRKGSGLPTCLEIWEPWYHLLATKFPDSLGTPQARWHNTVGWIQLAGQGLSTPAPVQRSKMVNKSRPKQPSLGPRPDKMALQARSYPSYPWL